MHKGTNDCTGPSRRSFMRRLAGFAPWCAAWMRPSVAQNQPPFSGRNDVPSSGAHVVLLGTKGGPGVDLMRNETASAVIVDGVPYLVDCGYGTMRALVACGIQYTRIATIFFTHLHDDHTSDFASLLSHQWTLGRTEPTNVYGPYGTELMVEGAEAFFKANTEIKMVNEGLTVRPESLFHCHELAATVRPNPVFKDARITVTSVENTHYPEGSKREMPHRSLSYRFQTATRSIVFSGDTAYCKSLVDLARGADVFVCEVIGKTTHDEMEARAKAAAPAGYRPKLFRYIADAHATPAEVGRMASEAKVGMVVLNHLVADAVPAGLPEASVASLIEPVRKVYSGEVVVGQDLMVI